MKKLQSIFAVLAVVVGITGALAFTPKNNLDCTSGPLFYFNGTNYIEVGSLTGSCDSGFPNTEYCYYYNAGTPENPDYQPCTGLGTGRYTGN